MSVPIFYKRVGAHLAKDILPGEDSVKPVFVLVLTFKAGKALKIAI